MSLTASLKRVRNLANKTLQETADASGIAPGNLSLILNGHRSPTSETTSRIADSLGVRFIAVPKNGRVTVADAADSIAAASSEHDAYRVLIQLADDLGAVDAFDRVVLAAEAPALLHNRWDDAIAGLTEWRLAQSAAPLPKWVLERDRHECTPWEPQRATFPLPSTVDATRVPEPLRRRGVYIEEGEFASM